INIFFLKYPTKQTHHKNSKYTHLISKKTNLLFDLDYVFNPIFSDNISTEKCIYIKTPSSHLKPANHRHLLIFWMSAAFFYKLLTANTLSEKNILTIFYNEVSLDRIINTFIRTYNH
ncbi:hypothetical protein AUR50_03830, partial [Escherichia coli]